MELRYVRIYFDATTFDIVTKDRAAKFVDMISAIGGTLGLFTGFSIMSAFVKLRLGSGTQAQSGSNSGSVTQAQ